MRRTLPLFRAGKPSIPRPTCAGKARPPDSAAPIFRAPISRRHVLAGHRCAAPTFRAPIWAGVSLARRTHGRRSGRRQSGVHSFHGHPARANLGGATQLARTQSGGPDIATCGARACPGRCCFQAEPAAPILRADLIAALMGSARSSLANWTRRPLGLADLWKPTDHATCHLLS